MIKISKVPGHLEHPVYRVKLTIRNEHSHDKTTLKETKKLHLVKEKKDQKCLASGMLR